MIVTCPGCTSKYRVNNDAVAPEGSRMRCPKCETLFLAKPPAGSPQASLTDDALQQLVLAPMAPMAPMATVPTDGSGSLRAPLHRQAPGPITALFAAFDPSQLPPAAQLPPQPPPSPAAPRPSGLDLAEGPKVRVANPASLSSPPQGRPRLFEVAPLPRRDEHSTARVVASWFAVVVGAAAAASGVALFAWTIEAVNLDASMMPRLEKIFGVEPPFSRLARNHASIDDLRDAAEAATARGDTAAAVVLWSRLRTQLPNDPRAAAAIAKLRAELGDNAG